MTTPRKEHPYQDPADVTIIKRTLETYDYPKLEARYMAREIAQNLKNYLKIMDRQIAQNLDDYLRNTATQRRLSDNLTRPVRSTQTNWRSL